MEHFLNHVLFRVGKYTVTIRDALTLLTPNDVETLGLELPLDSCGIMPGWISSKIVDAIFDILQKKYGDLAVIPTNLKFPEDDYMRGKIAHCRKLFIPILVVHHWTLLVFNADERKIAFVDPERKLGILNLANLCSYVCQLIEILKLKTNWKITSWTYSEPDDFPLQRDGYNCGAIICLVAACLAKGEGGSVMTGRNLTDVREEMAQALGLSPEIMANAVNAIVENNNNNNDNNNHNSNNNNNNN